MTYTSTSQSAQNARRIKMNMSSLQDYSNHYPIPQQKWEDISMDFIMDLSKVQGKDNIFNVVDRLTKFAHFFAISATYTVAQVADLFF